MVGATLVVLVQVGFCLALILEPVILSAAKNLSWAGCRFFAALRMTGSGTGRCKKLLVQTLVVALAPSA